MRVVFGFVAGALLNVGWRALRSGRFGRGWDIAAVAAVAVIFTTIVVVAWSGPLVIPVAAYPFLGLLVLACAGATGVVGRLLCSGPVEWCGRLSYSIYMTHYLVVIALQTVFTHIGAEDFSLPARLLLIALSILAVAVTSVVSYYVVEEPSRQWIRTREHRRRQRRSAATTLDTEGGRDA
jgi:peptidoglycan/LPS O-acetylase OafA/YrhL